MFSVNLHGPEAMEKEILRLMNQVWDQKDQILTLNRSIASRNSEIEKLNERIKDLKRAGSYDQSEHGRMLLEVMEERIPLDRVTHQRKEIAILHGIIKALKERLGDE